jgi:hypothetical protein
VGFAGTKDSWVSTGSLAHRGMLIDQFAVGGATVLAKP